MRWGFTGCCEPQLLVCEALQGSLSSLMWALIIRTNFFTEPIIPVHVSRS